MAAQQVPAEHYIAVLSIAAAPAEYAGMDGLIVHIAQTERDFERQEHETIEHVADDIWNKSSRRKILARSSANEQPPDPSYEFVGHDVGHLHIAGGVYSLIVHYLLGNRPSGSAGFVLNEHQLLDTREEATKLLAEWRAWTPADAGDKEVFDDDDVIQPYAIFKARHWQGLNWQ